MSTKFRLQALPLATFSSLLGMSDEELLVHSGRWLVADATPGYPCRVSLEDAQVGERFLAVPFVHLDVQSPYRASGPVFVRETAQPVSLSVGEIPVMFHHRLLSLRGYDQEGMMVAAKVVQGTQLAAAIVEHFETRDVEFQHIHNANPGCFNCAVHRA